MLRKKRDILEDEEKAGYTWLVEIDGDPSPELRQTWPSERAAGLVECRCEEKEEGAVIGARKTHRWLGLISQGRRLCGLAEVEVGLVCVR